VDRLEADAAVGESDDPAGPALTAQRALPSVWPLPGAAADALFAHPAERDLAEILTRFGVRWAYEPTSFALDYGLDGRPSEMFTPDFYLPDERLYVELTTMRQRLVTRKNRKLRRLREVYPDIRIRILYRRDYHQLIDCHLQRPPEGYVPRITGTIATSIEIARRVDALAGEIAAAELLAGDRVPALAIVASPSASRFARDLQAALDRLGVRLDWDAVATQPTPDRSGRLRGRPRDDLRGRRVLVVTDVVSTGLSVWRLAGWLARSGAADVNVCGLVDRAEARLVTLPLRHRGFATRGDLVVGYGLRLRREYAALPDLCSMIWEAIGDEPDE
jgi:hypoxanthine-guanine phosphoribosyltransferase